MAPLSWESAHQYVKSITAGRGFVGGGGAVEGGGVGTGELTATSVSKLQNGTTVSPQLSA